jgi:repressor LexA
MSNLTKRQKQILDFIIKNINSYGFPPSTSEIQENFSFKSPNSVQDHLAALERKGYISRHPHKSRGIELLICTNTKQENGNGNTTEIPIVGRVAAGSPILAQENIEGTLAVDKSIIRNPNNVFALRVKGDSMIDDHILDGDLVIVKSQATAENGDIVVGIIDNEATVKRFYRKNNYIELRPSNPKYKPLILKEDFRINGKVIGLLRI